MSEPTMPPKAPRFLIVNADDFGITGGVNRGIIEAHEQGIVTSASLMVRYPAATEASAYARKHPKLSVGLHFDLGEWRCGPGGWEVSYRVVDENDAGAVQQELERQLATFRELMRDTPTHLDSHQHMHLSEPARSLVLESAKALRIPVRSCLEGISYCGNFYGQAGSGEPFLEGISAAQLVKTIQSLGEGWTELGCHPGYADQLDSVYSQEREIEIRVLCDPRVRSAVEAEGIQLRSFRELQL